MILKKEKTQKKLSKKTQLDLIEYFLEKYQGKFEIDINENGLNFNFKSSNEPKKEKG